MDKRACSIFAIILSISVPCWWPVGVGAQVTVLPPVLPVLPVPMPLLLLMPMLVLWPILLPMPSMPRLPDPLPTDVPPPYEAASERSRALVMVVTELAVCPYALLPMLLSVALADDGLVTAVQLLPMVPRTPVMLSLRPPSIVPLDPPGPPEPIVRPGRDFSAADSSSCSSSHRTVSSAACDVDRNIAVPRRM